MEGIDLFTEIGDEQIVDVEPCPLDQLAPGTGALCEPRPAAERASWDGRSYAMHTGRSIKELPPIAARPSAYETADIVVEHGVAIPMPGRPSNVETADIIRRSVVPRSNTPAGVHRFSLRRDGLIEVEGATLSQLSALIRRAPSASFRRAMDISADGTTFVRFPVFSRLTELDMLSANEELPSGAYIGSLADTGIAAMFARIHEHRSTGRLVFDSPFGDRRLRTEIQVLRGAPTHVATSEPTLEAPSQLIRYRLVDSDDMRAAVHSSVALQVPFLRLISQRVGVQVGKLAMRFASERLEPLAGQTNGSYAFSSMSPERTVPLATSLLPFLPGMYRRGASIARLRGLLAPHITKTFLRTTRFEAWLPELRLSNVEAFGVSSFGYTRTLGQAVASIGDERFALAIAHLLIELGMIAPVA